MITVEITIRRATGCTGLGGSILFNAIFPAHHNFRWDPDLALYDKFLPEGLSVTFKGFEYKPESEIVVSDPVV